MLKRPGTLECFQERDCDGKVRESILGNDELLNSSLSDEFEVTRYTTRDKLSMFRLQLVCGLCAYGHHSPFDWELVSEKQQRNVH